jgi:hypothetical protein
MAVPSSADYEYARRQLDERLRWADPRFKEAVVKEVAHIIAETREYAADRQHPLFKQYRKHYSPHEKHGPEEHDDLRCVDLLNEFATSCHFPLLGEGETVHRNCFAQLRHLVSDVRYHERRRLRSEDKEKIRDEVREEVVREISEKLSEILPIVLPGDGGDASYTQADHDRQWNADNEDAACDGTGSGP